MKIIKIPETTTELRDHKIFIEAVREFNIFQKNIQEYCKKIVFDEYLKNDKEWKKVLSPKDMVRVLDSDKKRNFYCYKTNEIIPCSHGSNSRRNPGWIMGDETGTEETFTMSDDGTAIFMSLNWQTQEARFEHIPWIPRSKTYVIDLVEKSVQLKSDYVLSEIKRLEKKIAHDEMVIEHGIMIVEHEKKKRKYQNIFENKKSNGN